MSRYPDDFKGTNMDDREDKIDTRNEDEIIESRNHIQEMIDNSHPESILGCMAKFKESIDALTITMQKAQNEIVMDRLKND